MKNFRYSIFSKCVLHSCLFISTIIIIFCCINIAEYLTHYNPDDTFYETYSFEERYSKYMERVASYIQYCERGYIPDKSYIINSNLPTDTYYFLNEREEDQNTFEFYDKKLNQENSNFIYYVKNLVSGKEYCSPVLLEYFATNTNQSAEEIIKIYGEHIKDAPTYFVLNTQNGVYSTNLTNWGHLSSYDIGWIVQCITGRTFENTIKPPVDDLKKITDGQTLQNTSNYDYLIYTSILPGMPYKGDDFAPLYQEYQDSTRSYEQSRLILPIMLVLFLISFLCTIAVCGHNTKKNGIILISIDRIFSELTLLIPLLGVIFLYILLSGSSRLVRLMYYLGQKSGIPYKLAGYFTIFVLLYPWLAFWFYSYIRKLKTHAFIKTTFLYRFCALIKRSYRRFFENAPITYHVAAYFLIFIILNCLAFFWFLQYFIFIGALFFLSALLFAAYFLFRYACDFNIIIKETKQITEGDLNHKLPEKTLNGPSRLLAGYVNHIGDGLSAAVEEKLKSERLKTELITNVSHDIKTPLTSIINYVDLLKKEDLENEKAKKYISILEAKSLRLKNLIEDLVEASKASSGVINLNPEQLNLIELVRQSAGEFEDRFAKRKLEVVMNLPIEPVIIIADGRCTFRMIENIFSNAHKYALENTRIYVDVTIEEASEKTADSFQQTVTLSIKNISASKLNIPSSELMERFVRGDLSRNTEGSGLGLSIVKSLSDLQKVGFEMFLDGDLFKTVFIFPVYSHSVKVDK